MKSIIILSIIFAITGTISADGNALSNGFGDEIEWKPWAEALDLAKETKRPKPLCYTYFNHLENDPEDQIKNWVVNAKTRKCDLITQDCFIDGFESDVVLVIEDSQQSSNLNCYMRCISYLIVVKV